MTVLQHVYRQWAEYRMSYADLWDLQVLMRQHVMAEDPKLLGWLYDSNPYRRSDL